jgi:hypothetical protein
LQGIPHNFGKFLKEKLIYFLQLGGDNGITETAKIIDIAYPTKTKLGKNWKSFCSLNFFEAGDNIRFKFNLNNLAEKLHVFQMFD